MQVIDLPRFFREPGMEVVDLLGSFTGGGVRSAFSHCNSLVGWDFSAEKKLFFEERTEAAQGKGLGSWV